MSLVLALSLAAPLFLDPARPLDDRVRDLLDRMTLEEKLSQLGFDAPGIARLGIAPYNWSQECLHGVSAPGYSTVFPQAIGLAAAWDEALHHEVAVAIADETRGHHHEFARRGEHYIHTGLTCWSPNINIFRDPRWGRGQETYGEDPFLTGALAAVFVRGLQGDDPRYLKTIATPKHFAVHSGPERLRHTFDVPVSSYDAAHTYLPAFEQAVGAGAGSVMCAYNRVRGVPACASDALLGETLRGRWGFGGYVVSDCGAVNDIFATHRTAPTLTLAAAQAFNAGTDLACGDEYGKLGEAVGAGYVSTARVDEAVGRLMTARMRLGMFDPPEQVPYAQIPFSVVDSPAHDALALKAAHESIVLLKNDAKTLPLDKRVRSVAVIGPNGASVDALLGNYVGTPSKPVTLLDGIRKKLGPDARVTFASGSRLATGLPVDGAARAAWLWHAEGERLAPGLAGEFFVGMTPSGTPSARRVDPTVDFVWSPGSPPAPGLPAEGFSARWTGVLVAPESGTYLVGTSSDDGSRLYLDGRLLVDQWSDHGPVVKTVAVRLERGVPHELKLEYYQNGGSALIRLVAERDATEADLRAEAVQVARDSDVVVLALGLTAGIEGEDMPVRADGFDGGDRTTLDLPQGQKELLRAVLALGKPTAVVLMNGGALAVQAPAIVEAWYPGQRGGDAVADVLFGDYNPSGRLPVTFYEGAEQLPPFTDYDMQGRTYRYFRGPPLYPFGYGLSYTRFTYANLSVQGREVSVAVTNAGERDGDEVVQLYVAREGATPPEPVRSLRAFKRVHLAAGETRTVQFALTDADLAVAAPGPVVLSVGGEQPGFTGRADAATTEALSTRL